MWSAEFRMQKLFSDLKHLNIRQSAFDILQFTKVPFFNRLAERDDFSPPNESGSVCGGHYDRPIVSILIGRFYCAAWKRL
jgi:hypothetical protein